MALMFAGVSPAQTGNGNLKALTGRNSSESSGVDAVVVIPGSGLRGVVEGVGPEC
jgi:hypothetical protein